MRRAADGMLKMASSALLTYEILPTELLTFDRRYAQRPSLPCVQRAGAQPCFADLKGE
jgi:hypothetical protein